MRKMSQSTYVPKSMPAEIWLSFAVCIKRSVRVMYVCLTYPCMCWDCLSRCSTKETAVTVGVVILIRFEIRLVVLLRNLITLLGKWQTCISRTAVPMEILWKHVASTQNNIHNADSHPTNYSPNFTSD
jgi:hypothetical protein